MNLIHFLHLLDFLFASRKYSSHSSARPIPCTRCYHINDRYRHLISYCDRKDVLTAFLGCRNVYVQHWDHSICLEVTYSLVLSSSILRISRRSVVSCLTLGAPHEEGSMSPQCASEGYCPASAGRTLGITNRANQRGRSDSCWTTGPCRSVCCGCFILRFFWICILYMFTFPQWSCQAWIFLRDFVSINVLNVCTPKCFQEPMPGDISHGFADVHLLVKWTKSDWLRFLCWYRWGTSSSFSITFFSLPLSVCRWFSGVNFKLCLNVWDMLPPSYTPCAHDQGV